MPSLSSGTLKKRKETSVLNLVNDLLQSEAVVKTKRKPCLRETSSSPLGCVQTKPRAAAKMLP